MPLTLENEGTVSGEEVEIMMHTQADGAWRKNKPKVTKPPAAPERSRPLWELGARGFAALPRLSLFDLQTRRDNAEGPVVSDEESSRVSYHVLLAKPGHPVVLNPVYFQFLTFDLAKSFTLWYTIVAKNLRAPFSGELHVQVERTTL